MSRRSRRIKETGGNRWQGKAAVGLLLVGILLLALGFALVRGYLHSDAFRNFLSAEAGKAGGVTGEFSPFRWQGLAVDSDGFQATGEGLVSAVKADGLHTEVGLGGLGRGVWEIQNSSIRRLEITLDGRKPVDKQAMEREEKKSEQPSVRAGWFPSDAEVQSMEVRDLSVRADLEQGELTATGMQVSAKQAEAKNTYRAEVKNGTVKLPFKLVPEVRVDSVKARYQERTLFLTEARLAAWQEGHIVSSGEFDMRSKQFSVEGDATGMQTLEIFGADWAKRLSGDLGSSFSLHNRNGEVEASGRMTLKNGVVTALPVLDLLAAYADTRRFRELTLNEAHADWHWENGELKLSNLVLSSDGLVSLKGNLTLRGKKIDGTLRLGLAPRLLAQIPGAEKNVFLRGEQSLLWTPLRITGTTDDPEEDLSARLIAAAGARMFEKIPETGGKVLKFTNSVLGETPQKSLETGVKIIGDGTKAVKEVGGILEGIFGGEDGGR